VASSIDPHKKLWDLIRHMRFGMLTHRHGSGLLHAHPLTTQNRSLEPDMALYFFVSKKTGLGEFIRADGNVNVSYADPQRDTYVSISGHARISDNLRTKEHLFNALAKAWFPGGASDPDLELLQVKIAHAEYWDITESKTAQLFKLATAAVTGQPPHIGEHRQLETH